MGLTRHETNIFRRIVKFPVDSGGGPLDSPREFQDFLGAICSATLACPRCCYDIEGLNSLATNHPRSSGPHIPRPC
jgi:hypothetical protein